jgi:hypothetical protein
LEIRERLVKQASLIEDLVKELEIEKSYGGIERLVQLILQALLDLGAMVISAMDGPRPTSYSEIGRILKDAGVVGGGGSRDSEVDGRLEELVGPRICCRGEGESAGVCEAIEGRRP